ncbi:MAG: cupin domain-containing protein [Solirubrobacterales bacterium]|nr:cupin domain-containing protein [Solirubrobacterales bacterium]
METTRRSKLKVGHRARLALAGLGLVALGAVGTAAAISATTEPPAPKYVSLARQVNPIGAPGRALNLSRVVIQPGAKIPLHMHQGTQVSYIQSGTLTYTVQSGQARVMTGPGDDGKVLRVIKAGQTARIKAGQWLVEQPSDHHKAANNGKKPVVIYLANLLLKNAKPSKLLP